MLPKKSAHAQKVASMAVKIEREREEMSMPMAADRSAVAMVRSPTARASGPETPPMLTAMRESGAMARRPENTGAVVARSLWRMISRG